MSSEESNSNRIILNVGGYKYETLRSTLEAYPETYLGEMFHNNDNDKLQPTNGNEYFIDRNGKIFTYILEFYRTGKMFIPRDDDTSKTENLRNMIKEEMEFFKIPLATEKRIDHWCQISVNKLFVVLKDLIRKAYIQGASDYLLIITPYGIYSNNNKSFKEFEIDNMDFWYHTILNSPDSITEYLENDLSYLNLSVEYVDKSEELNPSIELNIYHDPIDYDDILKVNNK
ncbi:BTB/POZ protein [Glomus cerebriforme]|uniref:BTB/POZ protein n=1 Tax=Glomus cerebriforme TaxID=658196 RepID=A0A397TCJ8_9GLOM|nr:BTB/POZ protein [Glomus cerebriforme]